jgi:hypothetical protein
MRDGEVLAKDDILALPRFAYLKNRTREELVALHQMAQHQTNRYEDALRVAGPPRQSIAHPAARAAAAGSCRVNGPVNFA